MEALRGVEGVVQLLGVFDDSARGYCKMFYVVLILI
jgi:hypothetical protein